MKVLVLDSGDSRRRALPVKVFGIPTDEALKIAHQAVVCMQAKGATP